MNQGSNVNTHFYPGGQQNDINYPSPMRVKSAPNQPILVKQEHPDELKLLQSKFKIDVQKSSSRGSNSV
jgi:hypothetical protein